jgi:hypothetical protein
VSRITSAARAALVLTLLAGASLAGAPAAQADNCQPEELAYQIVTGDDTWESPVAPDSEDPRCIYAAYVGCPNQADPVGCASGVANYRQWLLGCPSRTNPTGLCKPPRP